MGRTHQTRRFFTGKEVQPSETIVLKGSNVRHMHKSLRLGSGDEIVLFDGQGWEYPSRIITCSAREATILVLTRQRGISEQTVQIAMGQALLKNRTMDRVVRQLTELGIASFWPFVSEHSVPKPNTNALAVKKTRWETISQESLKQCGRSSMPVIHPQASLEDLLESEVSYDLRVVFHNQPQDVISEGQLTKQALSHTVTIKNILGLIGPEGGFSDNEVNLMLQSGFLFITLGPRILRADTAAVVAAATLQSSFGDMGLSQASLTAIRSCKQH